MTIATIAPASSGVVPRPFLKWAGGKGKLIEQYSPYFPKRYRTYYEPFLGGGAIFFHLRPSRAVLMDINPELVNVYCCIRDSVEAVIALLQRHQQRHNRDYYYHLRSTQLDDPIERAARLIYLNKTCFNGLYRENSKGEFNVPMGSYKNPAICCPELLRAASKALKTTEIYKQPFEAILEFAKSADDFVYFDPPYHPISATSNFTGYNRYAFSAEDQQRLRDTVVLLAQRNVQVLVSNSDCAFIRDLYRGFTIYTMSASRAINSKGDRRGKINELLITVP
ncbi:MAG: DNA adenine methylase [Cyanobacteria bacterium]|nr:DNA adenine methylase [Cyanobacteriota bacterium]MDW8202003.1 DNA adenine methylase [Cyanobacteriota bacterium SKYGB_h_bin112]